MFNPIFRFGCEDIELAFRLSAFGFRVVYNPRAISTMVRGFTFDEFCRRLTRQGRSNFVFNSLYDDESVRRWTEVESAQTEWGAVAPFADALLRSARKLDEAFRLKTALGLAGDVDRRVLYDTYWTAFRVSKVHGIVEMAEESNRVQGGTSMRASTLHGSP